MERKRGQKNGTAEKKKNTATAYDEAFKTGAIQMVTEQGRQPTEAAKAYPERLEFDGILQSMSRRGDPYDNAIAENFFSCLKCKLIHPKHSLTRAAVQADISAYLETFYNSF